MLPVLAIIGRPNVGKSTLFNHLTKRRDALVADQAGVTRDRQYGEGRLGEQRFVLIDTGGLIEKAEGIDAAMLKQAWLAVEEADAILFILDGRDGLTPDDLTIAQQLRQSQKPVSIVVNKTDGLDSQVVIAEFHQLGMGAPQAIAASHGRGIEALLRQVLSQCEGTDASVEETSHSGIKLAVIGKPNVGKSTLVNRMLGEDRVIVYDQAGTTRDSIFLPLQRHGQDYTLIDTAGVRRRGKVKEAIEKFSIIKALQAIETANVVVFVIDAEQGVTEQDIKLLGFVLEIGRALVIAVNKWDNLHHEHKEKVKEDLARRLAFVDFAKIYFISALHGTRVGNLFKAVDEAYTSANKKLSTPQLTRILEQATQAHQPPLVKGRRIKLRYAHAGGQNPPRIIIHGKQTSSLPGSYVRYLNNHFRKVLKLVGTPILIEFKSDKNPYEKN